MRALVLLMLFVSTLTFAQNSDPELDKLNQLNTEITELQKESVTMTGTSQDVVRLQLLNKNEQMRDVLSGLVANHTEEDKDKIVGQVRQQIQFIGTATTYLNKKIKDDEKKLDKASNEEKLLAQKNLDEARRFSVRLLGEQWQNYQWMKTLGLPQPKSEQRLMSEVEHQLEFMSAALNFNSQQEELLGKQLKSAAESEKASVQIMHILAQRKVASDTQSLTYLAGVADKMGIDTSEYKQQLFETTGNVTNDLLNTKVIWSIVSSWTHELGSWVFANAPQMLFKILIFVLIIFLARVLKNLTRKMVKRAVTSPNLKMSQLMQEFFISMSGKGVFCIGLLIALSQIGLDLTPILTGFGVAGVIIGFALQDTLSNFASGMMLLIYRPFDVGDFVEAGSVSGKVSHMSLVNTTIKTFDNQIIIVPNSKIWGDIIKNVTHERVRRVDMIFGISYSDDIELTEKVLHEIVESHESVLRSPEPTIKLHTLNSSSVDFIVRPWVKTEDYWDVYWDITREVKMRFDREGISIPFPQQDVHLHMVEKKDEANVVSKQA
ncbi:mechanosensitive ion channel family protein [Photobacterium damselae]|uniref:Small-conductance mechanosensitive channel n=1 Tax=Photobacterium damselae subsp. damselae TaxID=85581 RepID=A0AAD3WWV7_PHODD|nr:mechanosensitive ion channel family protein [Photobacterium damselae]AWK81594.1 mechanosensitive ion channel protein MscS [Photobacterium damselae]KAB1179452.1 mechanosensitive ion channel family protein [Photobacterium damselae subsp. damselae]KAB1519380.1 mechanosensitive ion channel family protein [Photobacterium damselae subsp. damselae]MCG3814565.1 mechanosensitive ion channel family protein [Photobacterium damselae]NVO76117.1 mechanosensitive ion channel family protein [Photobacterium